MILVTGAAGFIGYHVAEALLRSGEEVVGLDNINDYYDPALKRARLGRLQARPGFHFAHTDLCDYDGLTALFERYDIRRICHLAAQAGVRYSLEHPFTYQKSNNEGFLNVIELARHHHVDNFVYASSSSVYGGSHKLPFREDDSVGAPISLYAATKRSNELVAHCYSHLFGVPCSGLRFFTVYGPWGRPDMALFIFTKAILENRPIDIYNYGNMRRNWTYVDDIVSGVLLTLNTPVPFELYNVGNSRADDLMTFVSAIERELGQEAQKRLLPMQPGDVPETVADIEKLRGLGYEPRVNIDEGVERFIKWYREYYSV
ncbi:MAG: NAD-dependent epimerase/dehydratase family protein [Chitinivibrionales bacterium]|nr:NAD-dependent epimerase/dehydratase family protein [Chitinivibrionales bacterium]